MRVIDETEADLRTLIAADFGPTKKRAFHKDFSDWLTFKARCIPAVPRVVVMSAEVIALLPRYPAINNIKAALQIGAEVTPWLSEETRRKKLDPVADMMFNSWQIAHFHLGEFFQSPTTIRRSGLLLFAFISGTEATLIDVQPHGAWTQTALLEILQKTNPAALDSFAPRGVTPQSLSDEQLGNLRANRTNTIIEIGGRALYPGGGIMSSGHAMRIEMYGSWFQRQAAHLKALFETDQVPAQFQQAIYGRLGIPIRLGAWYSAGGLAIIDKNRSGLVLHGMRPLE